jgi:hypothetical protein
MFNASRTRFSAANPATFGGPATLAARRHVLDHRGTRRIAIEFDDPVQFEHEFGSTSVQSPVQGLFSLSTRENSAMPDDVARRSALEPDLGT